MYLVTEDHTLVTHIAVNDSGLDHFKISLSVMSTEL